MNEASHAAFGRANLMENPMKRILMSSAVAILMSSPAFADDHSDMFKTKADSMEILGSEFIGARVYVSEKGLDDDFEYSEGAEKDWDDIGEINNIVLSRDGEVTATVIGVGGFLGIGEKDVAVDMEQIRFISDGENPNDYFLVFTSSRATLESAPDWDRKAAKMREDRIEKSRKAIRKDYKPADMSALNAVERDGYESVDVTEVGKMKASDLIGARVYGTQNEDVGEIGDVIMSPSGKGRMAIIDVGGFIGIGEKPIAVPMKEVRIMREDDGDDLRVYIDASQERLEGMTEYEERG